MLMCVCSGGGGGGGGARFCVVCLLGDHLDWSSAILMTCNAECQVPAAMLMTCNAECKVPVAMLMTYE